jgi:hypothetical protein
MSVVNEVTVPDWLLNQVRKLSEREGISVEQFVASAIAEKASAWATLDYLKERASKGSRAEFDKILKRVPKVEPDPEDRFE